MSSVVDSDVLIAILDDLDAHHRSAVDALEALLSEGMLLSLVNYAEVLVRPARDERALQAAARAIADLRIELATPTESVARDAGRMRMLGVSLGDGFAMATARARGATLATFDSDVRRALPDAGLELAGPLR